MSDPTSVPGASEQVQPHAPPAQSPPPPAATEVAGAPPAPATSPGGPAEDARPVISWRRWLWDHIGRISGIVLGLFLAAVLGLLMAAGYSAAGFLLLLVLGGMVMIAVGGRIHGR